MKINVMLKSDDNVYDKRIIDAGDDNGILTMMVVVITTFNNVY